MSEGPDVIVELIAKADLSGTEVNSLYMVFCSSLYSAIRAGDMCKAAKSLEQLLGKGPAAQDAQMGKWGAN